MFRMLESINTRPAPFAVYTAKALWTDEHTSKRMLAFHLNADIDVASRTTACIDRSVAWIASRFDLEEGLRCADFGCGPGLYALRLARRGARVVGIDFSPRSVAYAREAASREGVPVRYVCADYLTYELDGPVDLILLIMCDFCALGPDRRRELLRRFHRFLAPGGAVLLDAYSRAAFDRREEQAVYEADLLDGFWSAAPYYGFLNTFKYESEKVILDKYVIVEADRTRTVYNWLQYFDPEELEAELAAVGFRIEQRYGDVAGSPFRPEAEEFAVLARKA